MIKSTRLVRLVGIAALGVASVACGGGGGGGPSLTGSAATPASGNGTMDVESVAVGDIGGGLAQLTAIGDLHGDAKLVVRFNNTTGAVTAGTFTWGGVDGPAGTCSAGCSGSGVDLAGKTLTLTNVMFFSGTDPIITLSGELTWE